MISSCQFNFISLTSIVLFLQLFSSISYSGKTEKQSVQEADQNALIEHQQTQDSADIKNIIEQAESFKDFFIEPDTDIKTVTTGLPEKCEHPMSIARSNNTNSMLSAIFLFGVLRSTLKDTAYAKTTEHNKIKVFFQKLEDWKKCTNIEAINNSKEISRKNDLSEMAVNLNRSQISKTELHRNRANSSNVGFVSTTSLINNEIGSYQERLNTISTLALMLNFLSAIGEEKEGIKQTLEHGLYFDIHFIDHALLSTRLCPKGEGFSTLAELIKDMSHFRFKTQQNGKAYSTYSPDTETLQTKKNAMIDLIENADSTKLQEEIPYAIKALRIFTINKNRQYKLSLLCDKSNLAIDADPNDYGPNTSS